MMLQVEAEGDVATAVTLARILSNIPLSRGGPTSVVIFDIHALQVQHSSLQSTQEMGPWCPQLLSAVSWNITECTAVFCLHNEKPITCKPHFPWHLSIMITSPWESAHG